MFVKCAWLFSAIAVAVVVISCQEATAVTLYVSTTGDDLNSGTEEKPFATLERARDEIRLLKTSRPLPADGFTVEVRGGVYELSAALKFDNRDSGTVGAPNVYRAYLGEAVTISGGTKIKGAWTLYKGSIYRTNVGAKRFRSLFVNGRRAIRAREPKEGGYHLIKNVDCDTNLVSFQFNNIDFDSNWTNLQDVEVVSYRKWMQSRFRVSQVKGDRVYFEANLPAGRGYNWDYKNNTGRYYVENVFEGLDTAGEWYLNNTSGDLYYWPLPGEDITTLEVIIPTTNQLVHMDHASYIDLEGLTFAYTDWAFPKGGWPGGWGGLQAGFTLSLDGANHCAIRNCVVKHVGCGGIGGKYGEFLQFTGNQINDIGGCGISIYSDERSLSSLTKSCNVSCNTIHDIGVIFKESHAIFMDGIDETISHNVVYDAPYIGISLQTRNWREDIGDPNLLFWKPNTIAYNEIYHVMEELNDGGAIYVSGQQPGSLIKNNYIHDIMFTDKHLHKDGSSLDGIYLDEGGKEFIVKDNIVCRVETGLLLHRSANNLITNNIFVDSGSYDLYFSRYTIGGLGAARDWKQPGNKFTKNIIYSTKTTDKLFAVNEESKRNNVEWSNHNLFYTTHPENKNWNINWWQKTYGFDQNSLTANPLFADYAHDNFNLLPESPAFGLGFVQIDMSGVGVKP